MSWTDILPLTDLKPMQFARKFLSPFEVQVFATVTCECIETPDEVSGSGALVIRSRPMKQSSGLPIAASMTLVPMRGPARIETDYSNGNVVYEVTSYEPRSA